MKYVAEAHLEIFMRKDRLVMNRLAKHPREKLNTGSGLSRFRDTFNFQTISFPSSQIFQWRQESTL